MSEYNWCHGPSCHKSQTLDRVRGVKGQKVLRTRKIPINTWNKETIWRLFCSQGCLMDFMRTHIQRIVALDPRNEPLEKPINDPVKDSSSYYGGWVINEREVDTSAE